MAAPWIGPLNLFPGEGKGLENSKGAIEPISYVPLPRDTCVFAICIYIYRSVYIHVHKFLSG